MGHLSVKPVYRTLRDKLDRMPIGAPGRTTIYEILAELWTPEEAALGAQMPLKFSSLGALSRRLKLPADTLRSKLESMADKGLILDLNLGGKMRYIINPTVVGFFEFSMMRIRDDVDQKRLAHLFHQYLIEERDFADQLQPGMQTSLFRTLIHQTAIPDDFTEVLDWERASHVVESAGRWAVGLCHCRHVAHHLERDCEKLPMDVCLTIGHGQTQIIQRHHLLPAYPFQIYLAESINSYWFHGVPLHGQVCLWSSPCPHYPSKRIRRRDLRVSLQANRPQRGLLVFWALSEND